MTICESDWKTFRKLRERALDRFCQQTLDECGELCRSTGGSAHQRYINLYQRVRERDREIDAVFDSPRRSMAVLQIHGMYKRGLFTGQELESFSETLRERLSQPD